MGNLVETVQFNQFEPVRTQFWQDGHISVRPVLVLWNSSGLNFGNTNTPWEGHYQNRIDAHVGNKGASDGGSAIIWSVSAAGDFDVYCQLSRFPDELLVTNSRTVPTSISTSAEGGVFCMLGVGGMVV
ncbi:hypothetical protein JOM56_000645 [Amanita muscaria]